MKDKLLIIGGTGDIAKGIIEEYSSTHEILVTYRNSEKLKDISSEVLESFKLEFIKDKTSKIKEVIEEVFKKHDVNKVVIANGLMKNNLLITSSEEEIEDLVFNNLEANIILIKEIVKKMIKKKKTLKNIVVLNSLAGDLGNSGQSVYSASKGAMTPFVKAVAREYAGKGILINSLSLGIVEGTKMKSSLPNEKLLEIVEHIPLKRFCKYKDINQTLNLLLNTEYLTGQNIKLNGGFI